MIPITRPELGEEEVQAVSRVVRSAWLAQGAEVASFEQELAQRVGAAHAVAVSSGTTALHLALLSCGVGPGDEVLVPALGFVGTANVVCHTGARPHFVDVQPDSFNVDPAAVEQAITPRTRAVLPVHQLGLPAEMDALRTLCQRHALQLVEDAACAIGATYRQRPVGSLSALTCFSFHPRKVITTGEGGMICTSSAELAAELRALRSHGMRSDAHQRHQSASRLLPAALPPFQRVGYNYRMTDMQAAIGRVQLGRLERLLERRRQLAARYDAGLAGSGARPPRAAPHLGHSYQSYMVLLPAGTDASTRDAVGQRLMERGISTRPALSAIHLEPVHADAPRSPLPVTEEVCRSGLMLPLYPGLSDAEADRVVHELRAAMDRLL